MKECPPDKILNPVSNRCVLKTGKIGKNLINKKSSISISKDKDKDKDKDNNKDKDEYTKDECIEWKNNKLVNPKSKRKIQEGKPTYNKILKNCSKFLNSSKTNSKTNSNSNFNSTSKSNTSIASSLKIIKDKCPEDKIYNVNSKRCVLKTGKIGKEILEKMKNKSLSTINLKYDNNSCFVDTLFVSLFHFKNKYIYDLFFKNKYYNNNPILNNYGTKIQKELYNIYNYININDNKDIKYCSLLRSYLNKFYLELTKNNSNKIFKNDYDNWINSQSDVYELLLFLDKIFRFNYDITINDNNNIIKTTFIYQIPVEQLIYSNDFDISNIIPIKEEKLYFDDDNLFKNDKGELVNYFEKKYEITKSNDLFYIHIFRNLDDIKKNKTKIYFPFKIKFKDNSYPLEIKSVILHKGHTPNSGHYTTFIKHNTKWYEYDDLNGLSKINNDYFKKNRKNIVGLLYSI